MQARFLLGCAGSGKTFRCLAEMRAELIASPEGPPLILLAPKQATFQLERQLLADPSLQGYTRLRIVSFERLAGFVLDELRAARPDSLNDEGRVMVLRALLIQRQHELEIFRASARLTGFARELSLELRELQRHHLSPTRLDALAARPGTTPSLRGKLHDLSMLLRAYGDWLEQHGLQDANHLLDVAVDSLRAPPSGFRISALWLDGFAEMTPQELGLLAAVMPFCGRATLAFCLDAERAGTTSWLSPWSVVGQTYSKCRERIASLPNVEVSVEALGRKPGKGRFSSNPLLLRLEANWGSAERATESAECGNQCKHPALVTPSSEFKDSAAIRIVACANPEAEAVLAAREILRFVRAGRRFRECAVIVRSLEPCHATLARVFRRYGIPFFLDRRETVSHHPLAELTRFAVRTVAFGWRHDDWFGALKSGFAPLREAELDWLENAALQFGWQGDFWQPMVESKVSRLQSRVAEAGATTLDSRLETLDSLRQRIVPPFAELAQQTSTPLSGPQLAGALRKLWTQLEIGQVLERWNATAKSEVHSTVWEQLNDWLDNLALAFSRESLPLRDWLPILEAGLANLTVGVIPPALDQVLIGAIDRSRNPDLKLALVLGLNEGVFPAPPKPGTLLTDADRAALEREDVCLGPTIRQRLGHERYYGYIAGTRASERLVLTRAISDDKGEPLNPSPLLDHVRQITGVVEEKFDGPGDWRESEHVCELAAPVLQSSERGMGSAECGMAAFGDLPALVPLVQKWRQLQNVGATAHLPVQVAEELYGRELETSVSALEDFAACPFKFFAVRGLRLEERKKFQFDDRDKGSFQHEVLREFHERVRTTGRMWRHLGVVEARVMVTNLAHDLLSQFEHGKFQADGAARFMGQLLIERVGDLVEALIGWMAQYEFDPALAEISFGLESDGLPAWRLRLAEGRALKLRGRIDRVDVHRSDDDTALAVVMDYKSSARRLHPAKLYHGLELQLLSYLGVLRHVPNPERFFGVKQVSPVGVFFVPLNGGANRRTLTRAEVVAEDAIERRASYQHSGRFLAEALEHFDNRRTVRGDQFRYARKQDGSLSACGSEALPSLEFEGLREKAEGFLSDYGGRILAGEVAVSPFRIGQQTACERCDFRAVCRFDPWTQPYRNLGPAPKSA